MIETSHSAQTLRIAGLYRYPVKSLRGHAVQKATVEPIGFAGDRRWCVIAPSGKFQTIRQIPVMTQVDVEVTTSGLILSHAKHGTCIVETPAADAAPIETDVWGSKVQALPAAGPAADFLSLVLGRAVRLVYLADPTARPVDPTFGRASDHVSFADGYPMLLTTEGSLDDLSARMGHSVDMRRFRPNIVLSGAPAWAEDEWKIISVGGITFRVVKPCGRCVVVTRDADSGEQTDSLQPLQTLAGYRRSARGDVIFGQNLIPDGVGTISVGDPVEIVASGRSNLLAAE